MKKFCDYFILRPFDLNTTLTYVLMDNFSPGLFIYLCIGYYEEMRNKPTLQVEKNTDYSLNSKY